MINKNITKNIDTKVDHGELITCTTDIAAAYFYNNSVAPEKIEEIITSTYFALKKISENEISKSLPQEPAVPISESIQDDYLVCLEDGRKLKMLKRHLKSTYKLTPEEYRTRWNLKPDYPMVAPNYAKTRSSLAIKIGLGKKEKVLITAA